MDRKKLWISITVGGLFFISLTFANTADRFERLRVYGKNSEEDNEHSYRDLLLAEDSDENSDEESGQSESNSQENSNESSEEENRHNGLILNDSDCDLEGFGYTSIREIQEHRRFTVKELLTNSDVGEMLQEKATQERINQMELDPEDILRINLAFKKLRQMEDGSEEEKQLLKKIVNSLNAMVYYAEPYLRRSSVQYRLHYIH
jgi:hypothetical protein